MEKKAISNGLPVPIRFHTTFLARSFLWSKGWFFVLVSAMGDVGVRIRCSAVSVARSPGDLGFHGSGHLPGENLAGIARVRGVPGCQTDNPGDRRAEHQEASQDCDQ